VLGACLKLYARLRLADDVLDTLNLFFHFPFFYEGNQLTLIIERQFSDIWRVWRYQREVIRIPKSKKNRQRNGQKKKYKWTNNDIQYTTQKTTDRVTRTLLKTNNDLQYTTQKTTDRATRTPLKTTLYSGKE
jgi:hypothetical protein